MSKYEDYKRQEPAPYPMSDPILRTRPESQRTVSSTSARAPLPPQQYRSSPKPQQQQRSTSSPQQGTSSPMTRSPEKERPSARRDKTSSNVPPVSKYTYEPYRANSSVFEESEDDILARKKAAKAAKTAKANSKFGLFGSGKKESVAQPEPTRPYLHRTDSGDSLELMPTIAMGYENSMDKQMRHRQMPGGELRITGNGYYFRAEEDEEEDDELLGDWDDEDVHEAYKKETSGNELMKPVVLDREANASRGRGVESSNREASRSRSVSRHPELGGVVAGEDQIKDKKKEAKKPGFLKKLLGSDKSKKSKKMKQKKNLTDAHQILFEDRGVSSSPSQISMQEYRVGSERSSPTTPTTPSTGSPVRTTFDYGREDDGHADADFNDAENPATLTDVVGSIPIISVVFAKIDESEHLSEQTKLILKIGIVIWVMYEMQMIYEAVGRVFGR